MIGSEDIDIWRSKIEDSLNESASINFPDYPVTEKYGKQKCEELKEYLETDKAFVFGAVDNSNLAGWVWCHPIDRLGKKRLHIAEIAVNPTYQKQGVGQMLLNHVQSFANEKGIREIDLLVTKSNDNAVRFYEKSDYEIERYLMKKTI